MIFWIGLYPSLFLKMMNGSIQALESRLLDRGTEAKATGTKIEPRAASREARDDKMNHAAVSSRGPRLVSRAGS
jgi:hypothetical protein